MVAFKGGQRLPPGRMRNLKQTARRPVKNVAYRAYLCGIERPTGPPQGFDLLAIVQDIEPEFGGITA
jgi:hypothetical protein